MTKWTLLGNPPRGQKDGLPCKHFADEHPRHGRRAHGCGQRAHGRQARTGRAYKELQKLLDEQCHDKYLAHCEMRKKRAADGSIEFVSASSEKRFMQEGESCLIWNKLARDAVRDVFIQQEELEDDVVSGAAEKVLDILDD